MHSGRAFCLEARGCTEAGYLPGDQVCLGVDVEGCQPLHNLHYIHRLRHPRIEEAHVSIDTVRKDQADACWWQP